MVLGGLSCARAPCAAPPDAGAIFVMGDSDVIEELLGASFEIPPTQRWVPVDDRTASLQIPAGLRGWFLPPHKPLVSKPVPRSNLSPAAVRSASTIRPINGLYWSACARPTNAVICWGRLFSI